MFLVKINATNDANFYKNYKLGITYEKIIERSFS